MVNGSQLFDGCTVFVVADRVRFKDPLTAENESEGAHWVMSLYFLGRNTCLTQLLQGTARTSPPPSSPLGCAKERAHRLGEILIKYSGDIGDIWKHLPLAEILRVNLPRHYWETQVGSASYPLTASPPRLHGALRFLACALGEPGLQDCAYLQALLVMPDVYPGSPLLATRVLGQNADHIFCDIDPESAANLRSATAGLDAQVIEADGVLPSLPRNSSCASIRPICWCTSIPSSHMSDGCPTARRRSNSLDDSPTPGIESSLGIDMTRSSNASGRATRSANLLLMSNYGAETRSCLPLLSTLTGLGLGVVASCWPMRRAPR